MSTISSSPHQIPSGLPPAASESLWLVDAQLRVTDVPRASQFWQQLIGLTVVTRRDGAVGLGVGARELIGLRPTASRPVTGEHSGLYHVALHFASREEFGRVLARLVAARWPVSPVDHLMSEAIYLRDPDGIAIELAHETPWRMREMAFEPDVGLYVVDQEGRRHRPGVPLDVEPLLDAAAGLDLAAPATDAFLGHMHLTVPDLEEAVAFYRDQIGMTEHVSRPELGSTDLHAGGFPHRIALNTWSGVAAPPAPADMAGLDSHTIRFGTAARYEATLSRLRQAGGSVRDASSSSAAAVRDPAGGTLNLEVESART